MEGYSRNTMGELMQRGTAETLSGSWYGVWTVKGEGSLCLHLCECAKSLSFLWLQLIRGLLSPLEPQCPFTQFFFVSSCQHFFWFNTTAFHQFYLWLPVTRWFSPYHCMHVFSLPGHTHTIELQFLQGELTGAA